MKSLDKFILKSFFGPLISTFFICMFILVMQFLWVYADDIVGKGLDTSVIVELIFYMSINLITMALPLSILLASIMTFGNLGENYELIACKASGISLFRVMRPLVVVSGILTICAFVFSNNIAPYTQLKGRTLLYDIKNTKPEMILKEGVFTNLQDFNIKVDKIDKESGMMYDIIVYNHREDKYTPNEVTLADSGRIKVNSKTGRTQFVFYSGANFKQYKNNKRASDKQPYVRTKFSEQAMNIKQETKDFKRTDESLFSNNYKMLNVSQLTKMKDSLSKKYDKVVKNFITRRIKYDYTYIVNKKKDKKDESQYAIDERLPEFLPKGELSKMSIDSIMNSISIYKKSRVLKKALSQARNVSLSVNRSMAQFKHRQERMRRYDIEWHKKYTDALACLIFFFIGAPLGGIIRKGGLGMPVVVSVVFYIIYYVISMTFQRSAREGIFDPFIGVWMSTFIIIPIAIILTRQAVTDASIMSSETYINILRRFGLYKEKKNNKK